MNIEAETDTDAAITEILKWTVNPRLPAPNAKAVDQDRLVDLVLYHRVLHRLVVRLDIVRPNWCPTRLLTQLRFMQHQVRQHTQERLAATREIFRAMRAHGLHPPIIVKGFAAYALTNTPESLHFSGDIDPFAQDLPAFWDVTHRLGYRGHRKDTHEWAKLTRGEITLDVHQYYPVLAYPDDVRTASASELEAVQNPGHWHLPTRSLDLMTGGTRILWDDLVATAKPGVAEGTEELLFPAPALMCLIHSSHCFRSSVTRLHYMNPLGGFRLFELMSIYELARLPTFDVKQFLALVERFSAQDAVRHINALAGAFLGEAAVPEQIADGQPQPFGFPEHLIYGGWVSVQSPDDFLGLRGIEQIFDQIEANAALAQSSLSISDVPRLLTYSEHEWLLPRLDIIWDAFSETLSIEWKSSRTDSLRDASELLVHFGYDSYVRFGFGGERRVNTIVQKSDYLRSDQAANAFVSDGQTIRLICPVPPVGKRAESCAASSLSVLIAVQRLCDDGTPAALYLPLRLTQDTV